MPRVLGKGATVRIIHVLREPLSEGTVAANTLKHGTGALNIDASRVGSGLRIQAAAGGIGDGNIYGTADEYVLGRGRDYRVGGRWPANVILQHLDGCRCEGTKTAGSGRFVAHDAVVRGSTMMDPDKGWNGNSLDNSKKNAPNSYGQETAANRLCEPGCPVARLDEQSGVLKSGALLSTQYTEGGRDNSSMFAGAGVFAHQGYTADTGGASRFYKQVGGTDDG